MVEFITSKELRQLAANRTLSEQASLRKRASTRTAEGATFLSHSSKDEDLVVGATIVLENHGASVYIDEKDPAMPPYTNAETARVLKGNIQKSKKFVVLTSTNSKDSRWVPWELGIADGYKGLGNIALFPSSETADDMKWAEWEYLGLYDRIVRGRLKGHEKPLWMVWNHRKNSATELSQWLK